MGLVAFFDLETTGLVAATSKIIEASVILMEYDENYILTKLVDMYSSFNDPEEPISEFIQQLTHITDDLVKSHKLDWKRFKKILNKADVISAHNLKFDRNFLAAHGNYRKDKNYACSLEMIDWKTKHGQSCRKLSHICFEHGIFAKQNHRAVEDVKLLIRLLKQPSKGDPNQTYFQEMMKNINVKRFMVEVYFDYDYDTKEFVKGLGCRWNGVKKCWYKNATEDQKDELIKSLDSKGLKWKWKEIK